MLGKSKYCIILGNNIDLTLTTADALAGTAFESQKAEKPNG